MGLFERYLSVWVGLCILAGVLLGVWVPGSFEWIARLEYAHVNLVVAGFIWIMIYPMQCGLRLAQGCRQETQGTLHHSGGQLADQALQHGGPGCVVFQVSFRRSGGA